MSEETSVVATTLIILAVLIMAGVVKVNNDGWRDEAVAKGYAEYSQTTGKWHWKEIQFKYKEDK